MEHYGKFGHNIGRIQHIALIGRISIFYTSLFLANQTAAPILPGFQGIKIFIKYMDIHPHEPTLYPYNSYDGSNVIRLT